MQFLRTTRYFSDKKGLVYKLRLLSFFNFLAFTSFLEREGWTESVLVTVPEWKTVHRLAVVFFDLQYLGRVHHRENPWPVGTIEKADGQRGRSGREKKSGRTRKHRSKNLISLNQLLSFDGKINRHSEFGKMRL